MEANKKTIFVAILMMSVFMGACINDDDDAPNPQPPERDTVSVKTDTIIGIDSAFHAHSMDLLGMWMAQYEGYDLAQRSTSTIRRVVLFTDKGVYDSHVQGLANNVDGVPAYMELEHEHGLFIFDETSQSIAYNVEYDSIMNFNSGKMERMSGKMSKGGVEKYEERIFFSFENDGKRDWVRTDDNLMSSGNHSKQLVYVMKREQ